MNKLLEIVHVKKYFPLGRGQIVKAVDDVTLHIFRGETVGVVGESGCGKTTLGRTVVRLYPPTSGEVIFDGLNIHTAAPQQKKQLYKRIQMIFQDPYSSLNPRMTAGENVGEALDIHGLARGQKQRARIHQLLQLVGLKPAQAGRFPHEFSGGQRQRIGIARALAVEPEFIVCDEPISALDVSIQAQIVNLLQEMQRRLGLTYLFIAHDLSMVRHISDRVAVMYLGRVVELAETEELFSNPQHPYTRALLSAIPVPDPASAAGAGRIILPGDVPSPANPPEGCNFSSRCPRVVAECTEAVPELRVTGQDHQAACHLV